METDDDDDARVLETRREWLARRERLRHFDPGYVMAEPVYLGTEGRAALVAQGAEFEVLEETLASLATEAGLAEEGETLDAPLWSAIVPSKATRADDRHPEIEEWLEQPSRPSHLSAHEWEPYLKVLAYDEAGVVILHHGPTAENWRDAFFWALDTLYESDPREYYSESWRWGLRKREYLLALLRELQRAHEAASKPLSLAKKIVLAELPKHETLAERILRAELGPAKHVFSKLCYFVGVADMPMPDGRDMDGTYGVILRATYAALRPTLRRLVAPADAAAIDEGRFYIYEYLGVFAPPSHAVPERPFHVYHTNRFPDKGGAFGTPVGVGVNLRYWERGRLGDLRHRSPAAAQFFFIAALAQLAAKDNVKGVGPEDRTALYPLNRYLLQSMPAHYFAAYRQLLRIMDKQGLLEDPSWAQLDKKGLCERATALMDTVPPSAGGVKRAQPEEPSESPTSNSGSASDEDDAEPVFISVDSLVLL